MAGMRIAPWFAVLAITLPAAGFTPAAAEDFVTIRNEVIVDRPADIVWQRIGDYCAIRDWMKVTCEYASGDGGVGTVRLINNRATAEPMVARTAHSYTYWQTVGNMAGKAFHGTLAVEPDGPKRSRLSYTLFYDQAAMPSDEVRKSERARLDGRFAGFLTVMKGLAEAQ